MATNYERYFGTPEKAALTLIDIENEYQFAIMSGIKNNVEPLDEDGKLREFNDLMNQAIDQAIHPLLVLFDWMGKHTVICKKEERKELTMVPTTAHEFLEWLQEETNE